MRIHSIIATEVRVPLRAGYGDSDCYGDAAWKHLSKWILEIQFDNDMVGLGESPRGVEWGDVKLFGDFLIGKRIADLQLQRFFEPAEIANDFLTPLSDKRPSRRWEYSYCHREAYLGFEVALFDAVGKQCGLSLAALLGGAWRETIPTSFWIGRMLPEDAARQATFARRLGFVSLKMKASIEDDLAATIAAIRGATGEPFPIVVDPNNRFFRIAEALGKARTLDRFPDVWYEDPFPYQPQEWREFRRQTRCPLIWHTNDPWRAAQDHACDYLNLGARSFWQLRFLAETASQSGMPHWMGSGIDLGILDAAKLHASAAARMCVLSGDAIGHRIREDDLIVEELQVSNGEIRLPDRPGLGVTLDRESLDRYKLRRQVLQAGGRQPS